MRLRPCIDIHDGLVKQIVGSSLRDAGSSVTQNFASSHDAAYYADLYRVKSLPGGHIILLNKVGTPEYEMDKKQAFGALSAYPGGMMIGGGITPETAGEFLDAGASHVIVTSYVFRDGVLDENKLTEMVKSVGADRLVLDLSCKKHADGQYVVVTDRWQKETSVPITFETLDHLADSCDEFLIHAADVEGKRGGVEKELLGILGAWTKERSRNAAQKACPITYAGGVHALSDVDIIKNAGDGRIDYTVVSALDLFGVVRSLDQLIETA